MNVRIALAQINVTVGDLDTNAQKILNGIKKAKDLKCDIVVFPELAVCGYPPQDLLHKAHFVEENIKTVKNLAKAVAGITAVVGFADMDQKKKIYNAAAVMHDGKIKDIYHKQHLPNYGVFDEKRYFETGKDFKIYSLGPAAFAVNICEDIWVQEGIFTQQKKTAPEVIINISSSPFDKNKYEQREALIRQRAKEAKAFVCYVNLIGGQDELVFDGGSLVADPKGKIVGRAKQFEEDLLVVDLKISPKTIKAGRENVLSLAKTLTSKTNSIDPRLAKKYNEIERIYKALVLGLKDYVIKNGFKKVVIGLSGGIDSALVAAIAVEAIGSENVVGVTMPSGYTSSETKADAIHLALNLRIPCKVIPIDPIFKAYLSTFRNEFKGSKPDLTEENLQARIRGNILMALSNKYGWLVLTTGNKSEVAVGYCTLYGDMSGGFAIIKDVPKTKVYELARFINRAGREIIPQATIARAPTAELRPNQKDSDSLPEYDVLDPILEDYIEKHQSLNKMAQKSDLKIVKKIIQLVDKSEYKRRQAPPGIKITSKAFDKDWRLPITNKYKEFKSD